MRYRNFVSFQQFTAYRRSYFNIKDKNVLSFPEACEGNLVEYRNVGVAERMAGLRGLAPVTPVVRTH